MPPSWEKIAHLLRTELQGYGGLLALFEDQQQRLLNRDSAGVWELSQTIERQTRLTAEQRLERELFTREVAEELGRPTESTLRSLITSFPAEVQPMLGALIDEINHLIHRVRRGARQNQQLLARAVEMHQEALRAVRPANYVKTYSPRGELSVAVSDLAWQAAG